MQKIFQKFPAISTRDSSLLERLRDIDAFGSLESLTLKFLYCCSSASIADLFLAIKHQSLLRELVFDSCDLSGHNFSGWFNFNNLKTLSLSHCELKDFDVGSLFLNFPFQLTELDLSFNHLTSKSLILVADVLKVSGEIKMLNLSGNHNLFQDYSLPTLTQIYNNDYVLSRTVLFPQATEYFFGSLGNLRDVKLFKTGFNFQLCKQLSQFLKFSNNIISLDLSQNSDINDLCCHVLKDMINIQTLNLSFCSITDIGFFNLVPELTNLRELNLCGNLITLVNISTDLLRFNLKSLNLGKNPLKLDNLKVLPHIFPDLQKISLHTCKIESSDVVVPLLKRLPLNQLILWDNRLRFDDLMNIHDVVGETNKQCFIDLKYNNISSKMLKSRDFGVLFDLRINNDPLEN